MPPTSPTHPDPGASSAPGDHGAAGQPPLSSPHASHWTLDPATVFLNHGSFGACPRAVLDSQTGYRTLMEREPVRFFVELLPSLIDETRRDLGEFVRCDPETIVLVPNATIAAATIFHNLAEATIDAPRIGPGDEVLVTDHEYPACLNTVRRFAARTGATVVTARLPWPVLHESSVEEAILRCVTPRTRAALISHVTSPSALVLPVARLVPELNRRAVLTIIDGAHAPGFVPDLNVGSLGAAFYFANCHKWVCSPKGSAFLHVRADLRRGFRPLALSNSAENPRPDRPHLLTEFDYVGSQDYSGVLAIRDAIRVVGSLLHGGWPAVIAHNHALARAARGLLLRELGVEPPAPQSMLGSMVTLSLPRHGKEAELAARPSRYHDALQDALLARHAIQVPIWTIPGSPPGENRLVRISAQLYNAEAQYACLAAALAQELAAEARL